MSPRTIVGTAIVTAVAVCGGLLCARQSPAPAAQAPAADVLITAAVKQAQAEHKMILVEFGASWCGSCIALKGLLNEPVMQRLIAANYVVVPLTVFEYGDKAALNNPGAEAMLVKWGGKSGIVFWQFLDASGRPVPNASGYGFSPDVDDVRAIGEAIKRTTPRLTTAERTAVVNALLTSLAERRPSATWSAVSERLIWSVPGSVWDSSVSVSPNGRLVAYVDGDDLFLHDLTSGVDRRLTVSTDHDYVYGDAPPVFSRDSTRLLYDVQDATTKREELRVIDCSGPSTPPPRRLLDAANVQALDWSPDGQWIAVHLMREDKVNQLGLVSAADGSFREIKSLQSGKWFDFIDRARFSPDGRYLAVELPGRDGLGDVVALATDTGREVPVVARPGDDRLVGWSPDGAQVLFASDRTGSMDLWAVPFREATAGKPLLVRQSVGDLEPLALTSSGALYYATPSRRLDVLQVAAVDFDAGQVVSTPEAPAFIGRSGPLGWSPDGQWLAYVSNRTGMGGGTALVVQSADGGRTREIRLNRTWVRNLQWSPDGRAIAVSGDGAQGDGIYRADVQTGEVSYLAGANGPVRLWSASGRLYFDRIDTNETGTSLAGQAAVIEYDLGTRREREVYRGPFSREFARLALAFDGGTVYLRRPLPVKTPPHDLIARDLASGTERTIVAQRPLGSLCLSPDGRWIVTTSQDAATKSDILLVVPTAGGEPRSVRPGPGVWLDVAWAPDSRSFVAQTRLASQVRQFELWWVPVDGRAARKLDLGPGLITDLSVSNDGRHLAFVQQDTAAPKPAEIWVMEFRIPPARPSTAKQ